MTTEYKGFEINEVYTYNDGKSDFEVFQKEEETGWLEHRVKLIDIKDDIDTKVEEMFTDEHNCIDFWALNVANNQWRAIETLKVGKV